ncbi:MAG: AbrB/MazE/SpoVT family DNA-binding domain-containing protein [Defluviitaleaceae bacterium]|nr:AbrB/MazE/SpoVT family DNA-binding domain-containing protein [Defluviitaleaceae bacterium]
MKLELKHKIDDLGRILIPKQLRTELGASTGDTLVISYEDGVATIRLGESNPDDDSVITCEEVSGKGTVERYLCMSCQEIKDADEVRVVAEIAQ